MGEQKRTFADVKNVILSAHENSGPRDKVCFYNKWAEKYDEVRNKDQCRCSCFDQVFA